MKNTDNGYIAISRAIFDHPEFKESRPLTRLEAWQWLIGQAAWRAKTKRFRNDSVRLERGQLTDSIRTIAIAWRWPKSNVARWLHRLADNDMLRLYKSGTAPGTVSGTARIIITICNYDKFNRTGKKVGQQVGQYPGQQPVQASLFIEKSSPEPLNQLNIESGGAAKGLSRKTCQQRGKPAHGAKGNGMVWLDHDTDEWKAYAADFRMVRGADILPETRIGGRGNWFRAMGEIKGRRRRP